MIRRLGGLGLLVGLVLVVVAAGGFLLRYRVHEVSNESMAATVDAEDWVIGNTTAAGGAGVRRGDVVLFDASGWGLRSADARQVRRVIGLPGDHVACCDAQGRLTVNGKPITEAYLPDGIGASQGSFRVTVPAGRIFLLGDNRTAATDARTYLASDSGTLPLSAVQQRVVAVAFPLSHLRFLAPTSAFAAAGLGPAPAGAGLLWWLWWAGLLGVILLLMGWALRAFARFFHRPRTSTDTPSRSE